MDDRASVPFSGGVTHATGAPATRLAVVDITVKLSPSCSRGDLRTWGRRRGPERADG